jgi:hypothetical protein
MFYNKDITIKYYTKTKDAYGITRNDVEVIYKSLQADVQPYSKSRLEKDYGYIDECTKIVYLDLDNNIMINWVVEYENADYNVVRIVKWDNYMELVLNDRN